MRYAQIIAEVANMPLAIMPEKLEAVIAFLSDQAAGIKYNPDEIAERIGADAHTIYDKPYMFDGEAIPLSAAAQDGEGGGSSGTMVIPIRGVMAQRMNMMDAVSGSGGTSTDMVRRQFLEAANDSRVSAIVLDIDSPGGSPMGTMELGDTIREVVKRGDKPVVAQVNSLAASAAYWVAAQAGEIVVTPSGELGSIGVYTVHKDVSRAADAQGVTVTYIDAGKYKTETAPFKPLSDDAREALQNRVNQIYDQFVTAVARGRSTATGETIGKDDVRGNYGEGRVVGAREAVRMGMADRVDTLDATLQRLAGDKPKRRDRSRADAETPPATAEADTPEPEATQQPRQESAEMRRRRLRLSELS